MRKKTSPSFPPLPHPRRVFTGASGRDKLPGEMRINSGTNNRLWKVELQRLADEIGVPITVCHYPPGTSKWNKVEHRLFSFITINWRGKPLRTYETIVNLIGATTTETGLDVRCELDDATYEKGRKITDEQMKALNIRGHKFHPDWNYTISPRATA
jgi:hypothetical protein